MSSTHTIIGLAVGIFIGAMDFSLARSIAMMIRSAEVRVAQAVMLGGFVFRLGAIGILLWTMSRASNISFVAVCIGLVSSFTILTLGQAVRGYTGTARTKK